jgi:Vacuolar sorting-associated protein 13, N-terminal
LTVKDKPFSLGITLQELTAKTTNENWEEKFFDRTKKENRSKPVHKFLQINGFAVYVNTFDACNHFLPEEGETTESFLQRIEYCLFEMFPKN